VSRDGIIIEIRNYFNNRFYYVVYNFGDKISVITNYFLIIDFKNYRWFFYSILLDSPIVDLTRPFYRFYFFSDNKS
jgi:hypothetical protein